MKQLFTALLLISCGPAFAEQVYKCTQPDGRQTFSDVPCAAAGQVQQQVKVAPASVLSSEGLRNWAGRNSDAQRSGSNDSGASRQATAAPPARDETDCDNARRDYEFAASYKRTSDAERMQKREEYLRACR
ncbi:MAG: hypothetical protein K0Q68_520 [Moraxellaceae bacterium]|jgi:hypothetical protein|nr:hypothetical protein [Moraxellaceae bacterium]